MTHTAYVNVCLYCALFVFLLCRVSSLSYSAKVRININSLLHILIFALNVFLTINWMCLTEKNLHYVYIQEHIRMTNVKSVWTGWPCPGSFISE
jgi:hypothetical protein